MDKPIAFLLLAGLSGAAFAHATEAHGADFLHDFLHALFGMRHPPTALVYALGVLLVAAGLYAAFGGRRPSILVRGLGLAAAGAGAALLYGF